MKIFVLEDDTIQQYSLKKTLESLGYTVVGIAASATEGTETLQHLCADPNTKPDILLVDIRLPGKTDGIDFVSSLPPEFDIPHIYLTAFNDEQHFTRSLQTNPAGYILKPFSKIALDYQIRIALKNAENERKIQEKTQLLEALFAGNRDGIILVDSEGAILEWNLGAEQILGIPRQQALSLTVKEMDSLLDLRLNENRQEPFPFLTRFTDSTSKVICEDVSNPIWDLVRTRESGLQYLQVSFFPVGLKSLKYTCFMIRDVTFLKQKEEEIRSTNRELFILNHVLATLGKTFHTDEVLPDVLEVLTRGVEATASLLYLFEDQSQSLILKASINVNADVQESLKEIKIGETILGQIALSDFSLGIDNLTLEPNRLPLQAHVSGWKSLLATPIKRESKLFGLIALFSEKQGAFTPVASRMLTTIAHELSLYLENAYLYQRTKLINAELEQKVAERTQDLNTLAELSQELSFIVGYKELFTIIFSILHKTTSFAMAAVCFRQESSLVVFLYYATPVSEGYDQAFREKIQDHILSITDNQILLPNQVFYPLNDRVSPQDDHVEQAQKMGCFYAEPFEQRSDSYTQTGYLYFGAPQSRKFTERETHLYTIAARHVSLMVQALEYRLGVERRRLEQVIANLPEGLCIVDAQGSIQVKNQRAETLIQQTMGPDHTNLILERIKTVREGERDILELTLSSKRYIEITAEPIVSGPDIGGKIVLLRDITEDRIKDEQIKAQERLAAVGQLAAGIAHDFNNILTGIIGYCEYLQLRKDISSEARVYLLKIIEQAKRAGTLIQQVLDFSRKSILEHKPFDLVPFLKEISKLFDRVLSENIHIDWSFKEKKCMVNGNPVQIQQILTNLLVNAQDALPKGGEIKVSLDRIAFSEELRKKGYFSKETEPKGDLARIVVEDNGAGIPKEVLPRVFEPFFTTKPVGKGTGLGLAQVYGLVQQHKGAVYIDSEVGKGTRVTVLIPIAEVPSHETPEGTPLELKDVEKGLILFVEDEEEVRTIITKMLEEVGYQVLPARNGKEALNLFIEHVDKVDIILSDVVMPEMDGRELVKCIQEIDPRKKIILTTGYPLGKEKEEEALPKVDRILYKPLQMADLIRSIEELRSHSNEEP